MENKLNNLALLMLSWKSHKTLENTLESYRKNGLLDMISERNIWFQEISDLDVNIASAYNFKIAGKSVNVGIGNGIFSLMQESSAKYVLFLENDWELICDKQKTQSRLQSGINLLERGDFDVIRYRHRINSGHPNYGFNLKGRELEQKSHLLESLYFTIDPDIKFSKYITKIVEDGEYFYTTMSKYGNFTNNPTLYRREFYLNVVSPFVSENFEPESKIQSWWENQEFKVAQGEGLFTHNRLDR